MKTINFISDYSTKEKHIILIFSLKTLILLCLVLFSASSIQAQKGLFVKVSLGPGYTMEFSKINSSGMSIVTKNHAIGWGITDKLGVQIGEFGGLTKISTSDYDYINLHAYGLGVTYRIANGLKIAILGAKSRVAFAKEWTESKGDVDGYGYGFNMSLDKEWYIGKRWGVRVGPQMFYLQTDETDYQFLNASINGSIVFYLSPVK